MFRGNSENPSLLYDSSSRNYVGDILWLATNGPGQERETDLKLFIIKFFLWV